LGGCGEGRGTATGTRPGWTHTTTPLPLSMGNTPPHPIPPHPTHRTARTHTHTDTHTHSLSPYILYTTHTLSLYIYYIQTSRFLWSGCSSGVISSTAFICTAMRCAASIGACWVFGICFGFFGGGWWLVGCGGGLWDWVTLGIRIISCAASISALVVL
jgi:hypothetical protein